MVSRSKADGTGTRPLHMPYLWFDITGEASKRTPHPIHWRYWRRVQPPRQDDYPLHCMPSSNSLCQSELQEVPECWRGLYSGAGRKKIAIDLNFSGAGHYLCLDEVRNNGLITEDIDKIERLARMGDDTPSRRRADMKRLAPRRMQLTTKLTISSTQRQVVVGFSISNSEVSCRRGEVDEGAWDVQNWI